jgi:hypothetical protein
MRYSSRVYFGFAATMLLFAAATENARAAEGGVGVYLLGARGPMAGFTPPPGVYFQDDTYFTTARSAAVVRFRMEVCWSRTSAHQPG